MTTGPGSVDERKARLGLRAFTAYLALCTAGLVVILGARDQATRQLLTSLAGVATPLLTVAAIRWYRPARAVVWSLVAVSEALWGAGVVLDATSTWKPLGSPLSVAEVLSTLAYLTTFGALAGFVRLSSDQRRTLNSVDATILAVAICAVVWAVNRVVRLESTPGLSTYSSFVYPVADGIIAILLVLMAARATITRPSYMLAVSGVAVLLVNDLAPLVVQVSSAGVVTTTLQYLALTLLGLAALHPTMGAITDPAGGWIAETGAVRMTVLGLGLLTPPLLLALVGPWVDRLTALVLAAACAWSVALVLGRLAGIVRVVEHQSERLGGLARSDHLTGLPNRRTVDAELERSVAEAASTGQPLVVALLDLDHFKHYNDSRGHAAGDRMLAGVGSAWRTHLPTDIFVGRYGGEEFLAIVRGRSTQEVGAVIESLREWTPSGHTFSAGLAEWDGLEDATVLVARADSALYRAKREGRACTWFVPVPGAESRRYEAGRAVPA